MNPPVTAVLQRVAYRKEATLGVLVIPGLELCTVEPPWRGNRENESCIPPGKFSARRVHSEHFGRELYLVEGVPFRSAVEIHILNTPDQSEGCIGVGLRFGRLSGLPAVLQSGIALTRLMQELEPYPRIGFEVRE